MRSLRDWFYEKLQDYLLDRFLKYARASRAVVVGIHTVLSVDAMFVIRLVLNKYGVGYLMKWIWWLSLL
jgi:hypothetical protein